MTAKTGKVSAMTKGFSSCKCQCFSKLSSRRQGNSNSTALFSEWGGGRAVYVATLMRYNEDHGLLLKPYQKIKQKK